MDSAAAARAMITRSAEAVRASADLVDRVVRVGEIIVDAFAHGHRLYACGNGGSAADAQHLVAELVGRFTRDRQPLSAIALTTNTSVLTAIANDFEFGEVFARQVRAHVRPGDILVGISTSGASENVLRAFRAVPAGTTRIALTGPSGPLSDLAEVALRAPGTSTAEVQAAHGALIHAMCAVVDVLVDERPP